MKVFCNLPHGIEFKMPQDKKIFIIGIPVSRLVGLDGEKLSGGKYGVTEMPKEDWDYISKTYKDMEIFKNNLIFAESTEKKGLDKAKEMNETRHGFEQVNVYHRQSEKRLPQGSKTKPYVHGEEI